MYKGSKVHSAVTARHRHNYTKTHTLHVISQHNPQYIQADTAHALALVSIIQYRNYGIEPLLWLTEEEVMLWGTSLRYKLFCVISTESSVTRNVRVVKGTSQLLIYFARARPSRCVDATDVRAYVLCIRACVLCARITSQKVIQTIFGDLSL